MSHHLWQLLGYGLLGVFALAFIIDFPLPRSKPRLSKAARTRQLREERDH